ncbi:2-hydroxyacid dehydrogenase [Umezakia ovalisporum]|jgi:D-lactate dehydrogenase|uniref:2-hydroxyacid dehydrogenase n=2 Tax=Umezakia ovalisporum TaxID=75695 RepID=A0AA43GXR3_9CYAN|nr:2-hydroxyacid dehydrogenase [Umezakia ovalisporum]MBI1242669.1 2-hydroxyacid dehydrogenase [Nostoc sp. RI_552]MDH6057583.1 2-hydroxyacid dehydrogenase [Umezakia ovalisporum FSS-43]MDH6063466.1 2-hydroxyacid dehydrogenase [Umezakia ovalisporum FSS-62]MDH6066494.1 2-hydroxyacid dehydrogenase [Umezakia ovalisporum APH033B]MDH6072391.1 2-hydroxyacid dehydrogenase [Umezakia ovalisporum CobakiLakeA]
MKVAVFSTKAYDRQFLEAANYPPQHELVFFEPRLNQKTAILAASFPGVCVFVHDIVDAPTLKILASGGTRLIALRCAGFNNVDLQAAADLGIKVVRVPAYSPYGVAEHAVGLILTLNRKIHFAHNRVRESNFSLTGLLGFNLNGRTVGIIGTGKIGLILGQIMKGFGCQILAYDLYRNPELEKVGGKYVELPELFANSDIISLHCPLTPETHHLINAQVIAQMKPRVMLINTSRGALIDTQAVIEGLKSRQIGFLGVDVYEQESDFFFEDLSGEIIQDDVFQRLTTFPNVLITGHQAFFTEEALQNIAETTFANISDIEQGRSCPNEIFESP